jgi:hypothetical protein
MASVAVSFGANQRHNDDITARWIHEQITAREREGVSVCATVRVEGPGIDVSLGAGNCRGGRGGRAAVGREQDVLALWRKLHLDRATFLPGTLEAFVKQALRI